MKYAQALLIILVLGFSNAYDYEIIYDESKANNHIMRVGFIMEDTTTVHFKINWGVDTDGYECRVREWDNHNELIEKLSAFNYKCHNLDIDYETGETLSDTEFEIYFSLECHKEAGQPHFLPVNQFRRSIRIEGQIWPYDYTR